MAFRKKGQCRDCYRDRAYPSLYCADHRDERRAWREAKAQQKVVMNTRSRFVNATTRKGEAPSPGEVCDGCQWPAAAHPLNAGLMVCPDGEPEALRILMTGGPGTIGAPLAERVDALTEIADRGGIDYQTWEVNRLAMILAYENAERERLYMAPQLKGPMDDLNELLKAQLAGTNALREAVAANTPPPSAETYRALNYMGIERSKEPLFRSTREQLAALRADPPKPTAPALVATGQTREYFEE
jgi:hypothetical protein